MNTQELFKKQLDDGATEMFLYGVERAEPFSVSIMKHQGTLDTFPTNLEFVRILGDTASIPLFREIKEHFGVEQ